MFFFQMNFIVTGIFHSQDNGSDYDLDAISSWLFPESKRLFGVTNQLRSVFRIIQAILRFKNLKISQILLFIAKPACMEILVPVTHLFQTCGLYFIFLLLLSRAIFYLKYQKACYKYKSTAKAM